MWTSLLHEHAYFSSVNPTNWWNTRTYTRQAFYHLSFQFSARIPSHSRQMKAGWSEHTLESRSVGIAARETRLWSMAATKLDSEGGKRKKKRKKGPRHLGPPGRLWKCGDEKHICQSRPPKLIRAIITLLAGATAAHHHLIKVVRAACVWVRVRSSLSKLTFDLVRGVLRLRPPADAIDIARCACIRRFPLLTCAHT